MRDVLVPVSMADACSLYQAIRWITDHEYPLSDAAMQSWAQISSEADMQDVRGQHERAREQLFGELVTGNLIACGHLTDREPPDRIEDENGFNADVASSVGWSFACFKISVECGDRIEIPRTAWTMKHVLWDFNALRTPNGLYANIAIPTADLLKRFPEPGAASPPGVEQRGSTLLMQISANAAAAAKRRGRRPEYDWDLFHAQVAKVVLGRGGLPPKKAELAKAMQEWCSANWEKEPAESAIRAKIALYYAVIGDPLDDPGAA